MGWGQPHEPKALGPMHLGPGGLMYPIKPMTEPEDAQAALDEVLKRDGHRIIVMPNDEQVALNLLRKIFHSTEFYCAFEEYSEGEASLCLDGEIWHLTPEEIALCKRLEDEHTAEGLDS